jgi:cellobiose phosphorylase
VRLSLEPHETRQVIFVLGYAENPLDAKFDPPQSEIINKSLVQPVIERWTDPSNVDAALAVLRNTWDKYLSVLRVSTPDEDTNR